MKRASPKSARQLLHESSGAEIAEAAAVLPLMFMVLLGIFWFGQAFSLYGAITRAAQEGARAGSAPGCTTCGGAATNTTYAATASAAVNQSLVASKLDPTLAQSSTYPAYTSCAGSVMLNCGNTGAACIQLPVQLLTNTQGGGDCGVAVYFQYPFKFWLPFTSINNQRIMLTASATARMETN